MKGTEETATHSDTVTTEKRPYDTRLIRQLRDETGAGIKDCQAALNTCGGDKDKAKEWLRKRGLQIAAKKADRTTAEGLVGSYIHSGAKVGVLIEVKCETDFVARNDEVKTLVHHLCLHIAAAKPLFIKREEVPEAILEKEREIIRAQVTGKPEHALQKIIEGKLKKFYAEHCLLEQPFVKNPDKSIQALLDEKIAKVGENLVISRFARYELGHR